MFSRLDIKIVYNFLSKTVRLGCQSCQICQNIKHINKIKK